MINNACVQKVSFMRAEAHLNKESYDPLKVDNAKDALKNNGFKVIHTITPNQSEKYDKCVITYSYPQKGGNTSLERAQIADQALENEKSIGKVLKKMGFDLKYNVDPNDNEKIREGRGSFPKIERTLEKLKNRLESYFYKD